MHDPTEQQQWRVPSTYPLAASAAALVLIVLAVTVGDPVERVAAAGGALVCALWALRDTAGRLRLSADTDGLGVRRGYLGWIRLPWPQVRSVAVDEFTRRGRTSRHLEIETDDTLIVFSSYDLGVDVRDALADLDGLRARS